MQKLHRVDSKQTWRCSICEFDNNTFLSNCQMCENPKTSRKDSGSKKIKIQQKSPSTEASLKTKQSKKTDVIYCFNKSCGFQNPISEIKCKKCSRLLIEDYSEDDEQDEVDLHKKPIIKQEMLECHKCRFENSPTNTFCVNCEIKMKRKKMPRKTVPKAPRRRGPNYCQGCNSYKRYVHSFSFGPGMVPQMQCNCPQPDDGFPIQKSFCNYCFDKLKSQQYDKHMKQCKQKQIFYNPTQNKSFERCTQLQVQTMIYMHQKSQKLHFSKQKKLMDRIKKLGYTENDLENLYHYIVNYAPIIIHMHTDTHFQFFAKDTNYRNQFETNKSSGSLSRQVRTGWQKRMFDNYHFKATDFQRVKYGTMNFTNDPHGVSACQSYGKSYFLLKQHVRDRCTMTDMDSSAGHSTICTFRFCYHLLCKLSDNEIKAAFEGSKAQEVKSAGIISMYKQIQIHGPVEFAKDIQRVYIHKAELKANPAAENLVKDFCKKYNLQYQIFGQSDPTVHFGFGMGVGVAPIASHLVPAPSGVFGSSAFGSGSVGYGGFGGSVFGTSLFGSSPMLSPAIKYSPVSFPYSSIPDLKKKKDEDYI